MNTLSRRHFLRTTAFSAATLAQLPSFLQAAQPDQRLRLGLIGCGGYGMANVNAALRVGGVEFVALADVDRDHLAQTADRVEKAQSRRPATFKHYQDLLKVDGLEAVIIASPPQWHALQFIAAVQHHLDVYCEKPLAYDIRECRAMASAAQRSGRLVQIGFQRRQSPCFRAVRDYLREGKAGRIICAEANIHYTAGTKDPAPQPPPASLDWELWCGPAPLIPYSPQVGHVNWRLEKTTGHGHLVDWGIHLIDATRFILGEGAPKTVSASGGLYALKGKITTPDILTAHFEFESCPLTWRHRIWGAEEYAPEISNGITFYGDKETVFVTDDRWVVIPRGKGKERQVHEARADMGQLHIAEFLNALRLRKQPGCPIDDALQSTAAVKLAMIAYDTDCKITWDASREQIIGNPNANRLLKRAYRKPWVHPSRT